MVERTRLVKDYMTRRLTRWKAKPQEGKLKAELANLRRGVGHAPGELPELWGLLFKGFPEELMSATGEPTPEEWAVSIALTMFALHQQSKDVSDQFMNKDGEGLGRAVGRLVKNEEEDRERVARRFNTFATSESMAECAHHLRGLIQLLRAEGIPLDYPALAADLLQFQYPDGAQKVRLRWGQDFYRHNKDAEEGKDGFDEQNE